MVHKRTHLKPIKLRSPFFCNPPFFWQFLFYFLASLSLPYGDGYFWQLVGDGYSPAFLIGEPRKTRKTNKNKKTNYPHKGAEAAIQKLIL
jgi:hypothetical protein